MAPLRILTNTSIPPVRRDWNLSCMHDLIEINTVCGYNEIWRRLSQSLGCLLPPTLSPLKRNSFCPALTKRIDARRTDLSEQQQRSCTVFFLVLKQCSGGISGGVDLSPPQTGFLSMFPSSRGMTLPLSVNVTCNSLHCLFRGSIYII